MAYARLDTRRGSGSTSSASSSLLRVLGIAIVALGLCSLALQGYGIVQQRARSSGGGGSGSELSRKESGLLWAPPSAVKVRSEQQQQQEQLQEAPRHRDKLDIVVVVEPSLLRTAKTQAPAEEAEEQQEQEQEQQDDQNNGAAGEQEQEGEQEGEAEAEAEQPEEEEVLPAATKQVPVAETETDPETELPEPEEEEEDEERDTCYDERDWGLVTKTKESAHVFCPGNHNLKTQVTLYNATKGGFKAVVYNKLALDLRGAKIFRPIKSVAQDGGKHDPRFKFSAEIVQCQCEELGDFAKQTKKLKNETLKFWDPSLALLSKLPLDPPSTICTGNGGNPAKIQTKPTKKQVYKIKHKTLLIARKDDHNPFFQISNALNAWILIHVLDWHTQPVRVVHLDGGFPSPIDELHKRLLTPKYPLIKAGDELIGKYVEFTNDVAIVPYEVTGPMMQHLNDYEPCGASKMLASFRDQSLKVMGLPELPLKRTQITITVITRRNYGGRRVQRTWRNEKEILDQMRELYRFDRKGVLPIVIQSVDFVSLSLQEQMWIMRNSDIVIGMHGAGMVNVMWTKPGTVVVEIFPKLRKRWGYRNLCQYLDCDWNQFRGGKDTGKGDNNSHKTIPWDEWHGFFSPLLQDTLARIATES